MGASEPAPRSIARVLDLLEVVIDAGETNLTTASQATGLTPSTALRHLRALEGRGYLHRDSNAMFSAGPTLLRLAAAVLDHGPSARLVSAAGPRLSTLTDVTGESSYLAIVDGDRATYVATCESRRAIRHVGWVGKSVPITDTAIGEALHGADGAVVRSGTVESDITAVAHAVRIGGQVVAALSVIGPAHRMTPDAVADAGTALHVAATALAQDLGEPRIGVAS